MLMLITSVCVLFVALSLTSNSDEPVYRAVGDEVVLTPGPVSDHIASILWRHGQDVAMEWFNGFAYSFRQFKERGDLSGRTGALTITGLTPGDSGNYTAEINHKETRTTQLLVISRVSKPTVSIQWDPDNSSWVLTCESDTTNAEPVTYSWISQEKSWDSMKEITITEEESETWFHCELSNPGSTEVSETVQNPFSASKWHHTVIIIIVILILLILGVGVFFYRKIMKIMEKRKTEKIMKIMKTRKITQAKARRRTTDLLVAGFNASRSIPVFSSQYVSSNQDHWTATNHDLASNGSSEPRPENVNRMSTSTVSLENSEEKEALLGSSQEPESDVSSETRRKDEVCGESNQEPTANPEPLSQTDIRASPDQVLTDATSEAEETSVVPSDSDSPSQDPPVQEQAADLPDET